MAIEVLKHVGEYKEIKITVAGPSSYSAGGPTITATGFNRILAVKSLGITGGYSMSVADANKNISGNSFKAPIYQYDYPSTAAGPAVQVPDATDLSGETIVAILEVV